MHSRRHERLPVQTTVHTWRNTGGVLGHQQSGKEMIVYHVTTWKKLNRYMSNGGIKPPVRAWKTIEEAERFSKQTGRRIILRLKVPDDAETLGGHKGMAVVLHGFFAIDGF